MDPVVAMVEMRRVDVAWDERWEHAFALRQWLRRGGFVPMGETFAGLFAEAGEVCERGIEAAIAADGLVAS